ncbi:Rnf-Nqr domain containing protein, partial [Oleiphilus sp. HI0086]
MPEQSEGAKQSFVSSGEFNKLVKNGLWDNNPALVQLLGLCPLLA